MKTQVQKAFDKRAKHYETASFKFLQSKRIKAIKNNISSNDIVLEVGCGNGAILKNINSKLTVGIDLSYNMLIEAKKHCNSFLINADAEYLPFKNKTFDKIFVSEVLYYLPNLDKFLQETKRCLKPDGKFLILSLNSPYNFIRTLKNKLKISGISAKEDIGYPFIKLSILKKQLKKYFEIEKVQSLPFKFFPARYSLLYFIICKNVSKEMAET